MITPSHNPWKNSTWILAGILLLSLLGNWFQSSIRKNDRIANELNLAKSNTTIATKEAQIAMREATIDSIRKDRSKDSLQATMSQAAFKAQIGKLRLRISQLPQKMVYNPDSATVDSLRLSFSLKDSAINTQAIRITDLEAEKTMMSDSFHKEITQLTDNRNDQIAIANQLQSQLVESQSDTRKEKRKRKFWRTVSVAAAGGIAFLLLKPN